MHHAIHCHALSGAQAQEITDQNFFDGTFNKRLGPPHLRGLHAQAQKILNCLSRAPFGAVLEIATKEDQDHNHARRFVIHARTPLRQDLRQKRSDERKRIGRSCTECHEGVHIRRATPKRWKSAAIKIQPWPKEHSSRKDALNDPIDLLTDHSRYQRLKARKNMPAHTK